MTLRALVSTLAVLALAASAHAAPMTGHATFTVDLGFGPLSASGSGTVDVSGGVVTVPAGLVTVPGSLVVPVTSTTTFQSVSLSGFSNLAGTFALGGVASQAPGEICPPGGPVANASGGAACNVGGGLGGPMGVLGVIHLTVLPTVVVPIDLGALGLGAGGSTNVPFIVDAAAWTTGTAALNTGVGTRTAGGAATASGFQLVTPFFFAACGSVLPVFASFTITGLTSVPEPALLASLWLGLLAVVVWTRKR